MAVQKGLQYYKQLRLFSHIKRYITKLHKNRRGFFECLFQASGIWYKQHLTERLTQLAVKTIETVT